MKKVYEIYIVKEDGLTMYNVKNVNGLGFKTLCALPIRNLNEPVELEVFVNDYKLTANIDYYVDNNTSIIFKNPLCQGDKITIVDSILDNAKIITKSSYDKTAFLKIFSSFQKFRYNHRYLMNLIVEDKDFTMDFNTKYDPFFTTVKKIRLDTGDLLSKVSDEQISKVIYLNSKEALEILGDDVDEIESYVKNYVRYKTDIDLCYSIYLTITGKIGSFSKKVGDLEVSNSVKLPYLDDMIKRFKELLKPAEDSLSGNNIAAASVVKAGSSEYPVSSRGVF